eukprot:TRINITY_DN105659_c0_g1_i1.p1 TRINITY_DN105659_c0_g1~~TRINITY_DN105659_c0_g1_i1.p1  ORF type:complete len:174 (+),score=9.10 TRINITY_DN105659_c0_g1_i1:152-673(+)
MAEDLAIIETYTRMQLAADECRWEDWKTFFLPEVDVDTSAINSKPPEKVQRDAWLESYWASTKYKVIMKFLTNHSVTLDETGKKATACCNVKVLHVLPGAPGGETLTSHGGYTITLVKTEEGWKISGMKTKLYYLKGNKNLRVLAAKSQQWLYGFTLKTINPLKVRYRVYAVN